MSVFTNALEGLKQKLRNYQARPAPQVLNNPITRAVVPAVNKVTERVSVPVANQFVKVDNLISAGLMGMVDESTKPVRSVQDILGLPIRPATGLIQGAVKGLTDPNYSLYQGTQDLGSRLGVNPAVTVPIGLGLEVIAPGPGEWGKLGKVSKAGKIDDLVRATNAFDPSKVVPDIVKTTDVPLAPQGKVQRGLFRAAQENTNINPQTSSKILESSERYYTPQTMKSLAEKSKQTVFDDSTAVAKAQYLSKLDSQSLSSQDVSDLAEVTSRLQGKSPDMDNLLEEAWSKVSPKLTEGGRASNAAKFFYNMTTKGKAMSVTRVVNEILEKPRFVDRVVGKIFKNSRGNVKSLTGEQEVKIYELFKAVDAVKDPALKSEKMVEAVKEVSKMMPYGVSDFITSLRYNGMLSSPTTQTRNTYGNILQAGVIKPAVAGLTETLNTKNPIKGMLKAGGYYKSYSKSFKSAVEEARKVIKDPASYALAKEDTSKSIVSMLKKSQADTSKIKNKFLRVVAQAGTLVGIPTKFMEASDVFFTKLISDAEYDDVLKLMKDPELARKAADEAAARSLFRDAWDISNRSGQGEILTTIDKIGAGLEKISRNSIGGWFVPFVRTPLKVAKAQIEMSPLGFFTLWKATGTRKQENLVKALIGTFTTGALMAYGGDTTWKAPQDKKQATAWYDSGKRPLSVKIGDRWIPFSYFGIQGLALAMPAAWKYYHEDSKTALSDTEFEKIKDTVTAVSTFWLNQTAFSGIQSMASVFTDTDQYGGDTKNAKAAAFTAGQIIPGGGFNRWLVGLLDPYYKNTKGKNTLETFKLSLQKGLPYFSQGVPNYQNSIGEDSKRPMVNLPVVGEVSQLGLGLPYEVGKENPTYTDLEEMYKNKYQMNSVVNSINNATENGDQEEIDRLSNTINKKQSLLPVANAAEIPETTTPVTMQDIITRKVEEKRVNSQIDKVMELPIDQTKKTDMLKKIGITDTQLDAWKTKEIKSFDTAETAEYITGLTQPDFVDMYKKKILTTDVAKELERQGFIPDADALMDKMKMTDPVYIKDQLEKWQTDNAKDALSTMIRVNKGTMSLSKKKKGISLKTKKYSATNFRKSSTPKKPSYGTKSVKNTLKKIKSIAYSGNSSALKRLKSYK